jgi:hypothetical protein
MSLHSSLTLRHEVNAVVRVEKSMNSIVLNTFQLNSLQVATAESESFTLRSDLERLSDLNAIAEGQVSSLHFEQAQICKKYDEEIAALKTEVSTLRSNNDQLRQASDSRAAILENQLSMLRRENYGLSKKVAALGGGLPLPFGPRLPFIPNAAGPSFSVSRLISFFPYIPSNDTPDFGSFPYYTRSSGLIWYTDESLRCPKCIRRYGIHARLSWSPNEAK